MSSSITLKKKSLEKYYFKFHKMMNDRGYFTFRHPSYPPSEEDFSENVTMEEFHQNPGGDVFSFWIKNVKLDTSFNKSLRSIFENKEVRHIIIILLDGENDVKKYRDIETHYQNIGYKLEIFDKEFFTSSLNRLKSKFRIASQEEKESIITSYLSENKNSFSKLTQVSHQDRVCKWLGAVPGDIIFEDRPSTAHPYFINEKGERETLYDLVPHYVNSKELVK